MKIDDSIICERMARDSSFQGRQKHFTGVHYDSAHKFIFTLTFDILKMHVWDVDNNNTRNTPTQPRQTPKCLSFNRLGSISSALCWDNTISCVYKKIRQKLDKIRRDLWTDQSGITKTLRTDKWHEYPVSPNWRSIRGLFMASKYMPFLSQGDIF